MQSRLVTKEVGKEERQRKQTYLLSGPVYPSTGVNVDVNQNKTLHWIWVCKLRGSNKGTNVKRDNKWYRLKLCEISKIHEYKKGQVKDAILRIKTFFIINTVSLYSLCSSLQDTTVVKQKILNVLIKREKCQHTAGGLPQTMTLTVNLERI